MKRITRDDYVAWLDSPRLNVFITVTLKQALPNVNGNWVSIRETDIMTTGQFLRDRFTKRIIGTARYRRKQFPLFMVFAEGDRMITRHRLHIVAERPEFINYEEYCYRFKNTAARFEWVYNQIHIEPLTYRRGETEATGCIRYSMKNGTDKFLPEASFTPQR